MYLYAAPRTTSSIASVTTNGGTRTRVTMSPLIAPTTRPTPNPTPTPAQVPQPCTSVSAHSTPDNPTTDPTDKSIPAVRITNVIPAAITAGNEF